MPRILRTLCTAACCLGLIALTTGCRKDETAQGHNLQSARTTSDETAYPGRGENLFEKGQTKYFPVRLIGDDTVTIHDKWTPDVAEDEEQDVGYYIGEDRFDNVVKLINHLEQLDEKALQNGLVLIQDGAKSRPDWEQDINQLCIFAEFGNLNLWFRVPSEAPTPETEHAYWLVSQSGPPPE